METSLYHRRAVSPGPDVWPTCVGQLRVNVCARWGNVNLTVPTVVLTTIVTNITCACLRCACFSFSKWKKRFSPLALLSDLICQPDDSGRTDRFGSTIPLRTRGLFFICRARWKYRWLGCWLCETHPCAVPHCPSAKPTVFTTCFVRWRVIALGLILSWS